MFSVTMIASSTIIPSTMIRLNRLSMLIEMPTSFMNTSAPAKAKGMPKAVITAIRPFMKTKRMKSTSTRPMAPLVYTVFRRLRIQ